MPAHRKPIIQAPRRGPGYTAEERQAVIAAYKSVRARPGGVRLTPGQRDYIIELRRESARRRRRPWWARMLGRAR